MLGIVISKLSVADLNIFTQINKPFNNAVYSENNHIFPLNLTKYETADGIESILEKLTSIDKIKIIGLDKNGKLELFKEALNRLK